MKKALMSWSGGKDSALALEQVRREGRYDVVALLTTVTEVSQRISMHGVRQALLEKQAERIGLPLAIVTIPQAADNESYEARMAEALERYKAQGVDTVIFGDLFLADVRAYREKQLARAGMDAVFPLWGRPTTEIVRDLTTRGYRAITTCVDGDVLPESFVGRTLDADFFNALPDGVDPCGENGEFHSFVYDGPLFSAPVSFEIGEIVRRDHRFYFCDLIEKEDK